MQPSLLLIEAPAARRPALRLLPDDLFEIRFADGPGDGFEALFDERADVVALGPRVPRAEANAFADRLRSEMPSVVTVQLSGDVEVDHQTLRLAGDHVTTLKDLRRLVAARAEQIATAPPVSRGASAPAFRR